jgi:electron transfer flavoprotein beta subunit
MNASQGEPMKIVVLVKEVPDTYGDRKLDLETGLAERSASERVLDEIGERALEVALSYADAHPGTEVAVVSMASEEARPPSARGSRWARHPLCRSSTRRWPAQIWA